MKFGIEIECWSPLSFTATRNLIQKRFKGWEVKTDGSLYNGPTGFTGLEIVSPTPPLNTDNPGDIKAVRKLCETLQNKGFAVDEHCGLHVHLDAEGLSVDEVKRIFVRYSNFEETIDSFMPTNRRGNVYYAKSGKSRVGTIESLDSVPSIIRSLTGDRYYRVNLCSIYQHNSIEFRQHSASINPDTILRWVAFLEQFVKASKATLRQPQTPVETAPRRRGRQPSNTGISSGCTKIIEAFRSANFNDMRLSTIAEKTGLTMASVKVYISTLKTKHGIYIKSCSYRGCSDPYYWYVTPTAVPRLVASTSTRRTTVPTTTVDSIWSGIDRDIRSHYLERAMEMNGFSPETCRTLVGGGAR